MLKAMSLFAGGGIGETYLEEIGIETIIANELLPERAKIYSYRFPSTDMVVGDIKIKKPELIKKAKDNGVKLLIATPPCQGMSEAGLRLQFDPRNQLISYAIDVIKRVNPKFVLISSLILYANFKGSPNNL